MHIVLVTMKLPFVIIIFFSFTFSANAQLTWVSSNFPKQEVSYKPTGYTIADKRKLLQRNWGAIIGLQKGKNTALELGAEAHWRKLSLSKSKIVGATTNLEYNFSNHVIGYKAGAWMKHGRVNLTYGGNAVYFSDFNGRQRYGLGPAVGFRLAGFHLINGYNFLAGDKEMEANTLYVSLRYYFPVDNKFTWDRKTMKRKKQKEREREKRKEAREEERENGEKKGLWKLIDPDKKKPS